jgi:hypothetical protein
MQVIPLQAVPSQTLSVTLNGQACSINLYWRGLDYPHLYCDLYVSNTLIIAGVLCLNGVAIVRSVYLGFTGDLAFFDTQGSSDPEYTGLGDRWQLVYLEPGDVTSNVPTLA